ncbi:MAG TPA: sigma 54-interacting transcriptional regulator [Gemmatimonadales bacterium]|nr:sigma 54-interacting transcriptional regulator [Gemmatimonadales bacterium]
MIEVSLPPIVGNSPAIKKAIALIERFAPSALPVLLIGATGTGKELFARHIHWKSRRSGALVDVNCGALPHDIAESLLFGHRRGAFTGAVETVMGHFQRASGGTLFLDEVLHLTTAAQVKVLRALENGEVQPLGDWHKRSVDLRIVSAAQEDVGARLDRGDFRPDLFQRLAGIVIDLPCLADRPEDIVPLAEHFAGSRGQVLEAETRHVLEEHSWPGNVRELRLAIERARCLVENGTLPATAVRDAIALGKLRQREDERRSRDRRGSGTDRRRRTRPPRADDDLIAACHRFSYEALRVAKHFNIGLSTVYDRLKAAGTSMRELRRSGMAEFC